MALAQTAGLAVMAAGGGGLLVLLPAYASGKSANAKGDGWGGRQSQPSASRRALRSSRRTRGRSWRGCARTHRRPAVSPLPTRWRGFEAGNALLRVVLELLWAHWRSNCRAEKGAHEEASERQGAKHGGLRRKAQTKVHKIGQHVLTGRANGPRLRLGRKVVVARGHGVDDGAGVGACT